MVSHMDIIQYLILSYNLQGIGNINRIAWSRFWKISQVSENMAHKKPLKIKQTSLPSSAVYPDGTKVDICFYKSK